METLNIKYAAWGDEGHLKFEALIFEPVQSLAANLDFVSYFQK